MTHKIVYNADFGGFGLSDKAFEWLKENGCEETQKNFATLKEKWTNKYKAIFPKDNIKKHEKDIEDLIKFDYKNQVPRHDHDLVKVVETLGKNANGLNAELKIKEIKDRLYKIEEFDGKEEVISGIFDDWFIIDD